MSAPDGVALGALATGGNHTGTVTIVNSGDVTGIGSFTIDHQTGLADPVVGIITDGGAATVTNTSTGTIAAPSAAGLAIANIGGSVTVNNYGTITGDVSFVNNDTFNNESHGTWNISGTNYFGIGSIVNNAGTINSSGTTIIGATFDNTGTVNINSGSLELTAGGTDSDARYQGAGTLEFDGTHSFDNVVLTGLGGTLTIQNFGTLDFVNDASSINFVDLSEGSAECLYINNVLVTLDDTTVTGGKITESGANAQINIDAGYYAIVGDNTTLTLSNDADGSVLVSGTLYVDRAVTLAGSGTFIIEDANNASGTLNFAGLVGAAFTVDFAGNAGTLALGDASAGDPSAFQATISGFTGSDIIDLGAITYAAGEYVVWHSDTGILDVYSANNTLEAALHLDGTYTTANFSLAPDSGADTEILWNAVTGPDTWTNAAGDNDWTNNGNWSNDAPPGRGDQAVVTSDGTPNITSDVTLDGVALTDEGVITVGSGASEALALAASENTASGTVLTLDDGTTIVGDGGTGTLTINATVDVEAGVNGHGATLDGVYVNDFGALDVGDVTSGAVLTLDDGTYVFADGGTITINSGSTFDVEAGGNGQGATVDGASVYDDGALNIGDVSTGAILTLQDGTTVFGDAGTLTIHTGNTLQVEYGSDGPGATLDGVRVTDDGAIDIDLNALGAILTLDDGTTVTGGGSGTLTISATGELDVEYGSNGPGATLDGVMVTDNDAIEVGESSTSTATLLLDDDTTVTGGGTGTLTIGNYGTLDVEHGPHGVTGPDATLDGVLVSIPYNYGGDGIEVGATSAATLLLEDGTVVTGNDYYTTLTIGSLGTLDVELGPSGVTSPDATLDGVLVTDNGAIDIATMAPASAATLLLDDGTVVTGGDIGALTIGALGTLDVEYGPNGGPGATLDGVSVTDNGLIHVDSVASGATLTLDDGTTISGTGTLTIGSSGVVDIEAGGNGLGAIFDDVSLSNSGAIDVGDITSGAILALESYTSAISVGTLNDTGDGSAVYIVGNETLDNGTLDIGGSSGTGYLWNEALNASGAVLTLDAGLTIDQTGTAAIYSVDNSGLLSDSVVSYAAINADAADTFYIQPATFINHGQITADTDGGTLDIIPTVSFQNYGTVDVENGETATIGNGYNGADQPGNVSNETGGVISVASGSSVTIEANSGSDFTNSGTLEVNGGTMYVDDAVNGTGNSTIAGYGILDFQSGVSSGQTITFEDGTGTLALGDPGDFHGTLAGLVVGDTIDLTGLNSGEIESVTINQGAGGGTIVVTTSGETLTLDYTGNLTGDHFTWSPDGGGTGSGADLVLNAQNLVVNGGFETGDLTGWTESGNTGYTGVSTANAHSGNYAAYLGPVGSDVYLDQDIATTPGDTYQVTFWLMNPGGTPSDFTAKFGDATLMSLVDSSAQGYTEYVFDVTATSSLTDLDFAARQDPSYWYLDDVSVVDTNAPVSWSNPTSGSWVDTADWRSGAVPTSADDVSVTVTGATVYTITIGPGENAYANSLTVNSTQATVLDEGTLTLAGALTVDAGHFEIAGGATLTAGTVANGTTVAFLDDTGLLDLTAPAGADFNISGFTGSAANAGQSDEIELTGVWHIESETTGSTVTLDLQNASGQTVTLAFDDLSPRSLAVSNNGTDTFIYDPPGTGRSPAAPNTNSGSVSIGGAGNDSFVFHPGMGAETISNFNPQADTIELDHFANVQNLQQLAADITSNAHGDALIELGHNDSLTVAGMTAAQLQAHLQSFVHLH